MTHFSKYAQHTHIIINDTSIKKLHTSPYMGTQVQPLLGSTLNITGQNSTHIWTDIYPHPMKMSSKVS